MTTDIVTKNSILTEDAIRRKIRRMAFQVAEHNTDETEIVLIGIEGNGEVVAQNLLAELSTILTNPIATATIRINKKEPLDAAIDGNIDVTNRVVILIDDVSNTGRTLLYALKPLLHFLPKKIQTLVLVERSHKLFAVQPDYVGLSVSTTLQEHITVETADGKLMGAWLH
ncbi:MAG: phosphoribosyltransferase [Flaviaesturariibacter sp.]|nr:phosphoribosyltransferase [Flaviaesturariibacter sp.]